MQSENMLAQVQSPVDVPNGLQTKHDTIPNVRIDTRGGSFCDSVLLGCTLTTASLSYFLLPYRRLNYWKP